MRFTKLIDLLILCLIMIWVLVKSTLVKKVVIETRFKLVKVVYKIGELVESRVENFKRPKIRTYALF